MLEKENDHVKHTGVVLQLEMGASGNKISMGGGGQGAYHLHRPIFRVIQELIAA